jgi:hypothetical protein
VDHPGARTLARISAQEDRRTCGRSRLTGPWGTALARGRELAVAALDWYEIASTGRDTGRGAPAVRAALDRAAAVVGDDVTRQRIAAAYHRWLDDAETAARIGPRGVRPETLRVAQRSLPGWHGTPAPLFDWLRARITPEALDGLAAENYGADVEDNRAALLDIVTTGLVPRSLLWEPAEVLSDTAVDAGKHRRGRSATPVCARATGVRPLRSMARRLRVRTARPRRAGISRRIKCTPTLGGCPPQHPGCRRWENLDDRMLAVPYSVTERWCPNSPVGSSQSRATAMKGRKCPCAYARR